MSSEVHATRDFGDRMRITKADHVVTFTVPMLNSLMEQYVDKWPGGFTLKDDYGAAYHFAIDYKESTDALVRATQVVNVPELVVR